MQLATLSRDSLVFPDASVALTEPNGLLAVGGDLSTERLITAYKQGIFPWYSQDEPILWWSPDPRCVLKLDQLKVSRSLKKYIAHQPYMVTLDTAFAEVVAACAAPRPQQAETWITAEMQAAYQRLHRVGMAHSIEVWRDDQLVGGLYGIDCGQIFTGESMFHRASNMSKVALYTLVQLLKQLQYDFIDCQIENDFLSSMGASMIPRADFLSHLRRPPINPLTNWGPPRQLA